MNLLYGCILLCITSVHVLVVVLFSCRFICTLLTDGFIFRQLSYRECF